MSCPVTCKPHRICHANKNFATINHIAAESPQRLSLYICFAQVCGVAWIRLQTACFRQLCDPTGLTASSSRCASRAMVLHPSCCLQPVAWPPTSGLSIKRPRIGGLSTVGLETSLCSPSVQQTISGQPCPHSPTACLQHTSQLNELDLAVANTGYSSQASSTSCKCRWRRPFPSSATSATRAMPRWRSCSSSPAMPFYPFPMQLPHLPVSRSALIFNLFCICYSMAVTPFRVPETECQIK